MKIVIRAGGVGTRLWPWSRSDRPKQFLPIFQQKSCVQVAYERFARSGLAGRADIYISVGKAHVELARAQVPQLPLENFILEPAPRDTAAAIGLETVYVAGDSPQTIIASLGSDHYVGRPREFIKALQAAVRFLGENPEYLLAIACEPTRIETNYGHIKKGQKLWEDSGVPVFRADEFTEKPNYPLAKQYTESGQYLWNSNFFVWTAGTLLDQFRQLEPEMHESLLAIQAARQRGEFQRVFEQKYPEIKKTAIDYAVLEPASRKGKLAVLPVDMEWSDIGSWATLTDAFPPDEDGNLFEGPVLTEETTDTTVLVKNPGRKLVATIGVEGLAIVDTPDALLVCSKEQSGKVKKLVEQLKASERWQDLV